MGQTKKKVFFNASVIIAGLISPTGGSGKLISWSLKSKIKGVISEIVFNEILSHLNKISRNESEIRKIILTSFEVIIKPKGSTVNKYKKKVADEGDAHVLASASETKSNYLVTHDKKHLLILKNKIKEYKIVSPKELIEDLS